MGRHKNKRHHKAKTRNATKRTWPQNWWSKNCWNITGLILTILTGLALPFYFQYESDQSQKTTVQILSTMQALESTTTADLASLNPTYFSEKIRIPAIGVNALIEEASLTLGGTLVLPTQNPWTSVGWYARGPNPGQRGSAVVGGHLDRPGGFPAVFWNLNHLRVGNEVEVVDSDGKTLRFQVTRVAYNATHNMPYKDIFGNEEGIHLNLITSAGDWIPAERLTTLRLVVYTTLIET